MTEKYRVNRIALGNDEIGGGAMVEKRKELLLNRESEWSER